MVSQQSPMHKQAQIVRGLMKRIEDLEQERELEGRVDFSRVTLDTALAAAEVEYSLTEDDEHTFYWDASSGRGFDFSMLRPDAHPRYGFTVPETAIHYWPMNEGGGTAFTDVAGGMHATLNGGAWLPIGATGEYAVEFDGVADHATTAYNPNEDDLGGGGALEMWVYWRDDNDEDAHGVWGSPRFYIYNREGDLQTGYGNDWNRGDAQPQDEWLHIVVSNDGTTTYAYIDAVEVDTYSSTLSGTHSDNFWIGATGDGNRFADCLVGEVCIHGTYLDPADVTDRFDDRAPVYQGWSGFPDQPLTAGYGVNYGKHYGGSGEPSEPPASGFGEDFGEDFGGGEES